MEEYEKRGYLSGDFKLFHLRDTLGTKPDYHYHEFYKILLLVSGSGSYVVEGKRYLLQPGDVVLVGRGCVHRPEFECSTPYERYILYISPEFLIRCSEPDCCLKDCFSARYGHVLRLEKSARQVLFSAAEELEQELSGREFGHTILSRECLLRLLVQIGRFQRRDGAYSPAPMAAGSDRVLQILAYLDAHLAEDLSIDDLAEQFYLSKYHMMRMFRRETGCTIHTYLTQRRLMLARDYIRRGSKTTDACFRSGFRSYCSFTRAYAKYYGTTPTGRLDPPLIPEDCSE